MSFGALVLVTALLGALAKWRLNLAISSANDVAAKRVVEVQVARAVMQTALQARWDLRGYALGAGDDYLLQGRKGLADLKEHLKAADELAEKFPDLSALRQGASEARASLALWESQIDRLESAHKNLATQEGIMDSAAKSFLQGSHDLTSSEEQRLSTEAEEKADAAKLNERMAKISLAQDIIDLGNAIRVNNFKAQNAKDVNAMQKALKGFATLENAFVHLESMLRVQADKDVLAKVRDAAEDYKSSMENVSSSITDILSLQEKIVDSSGVVVAKASGVMDGGMQGIDEAAVNVSSGLSLTNVILLVGVVIALVVGVLVAWLSTRAITLPIREGVNALASTASQISTTVAQLAANASEAAAAVAETTTTVDEVRQTAQVAADRAKAVADSAQGAASAAETGRQATEQTVQGLNLIREQMSSIGENITRLSEQSQAVGDIVATVTDLAEQSNLLAVNASIEAAKAGDMGKGFAVVAQEIRNLAEQSKDSTKQVRSILTDVQKATSKAVLSAEQGSMGVADGGRQADEAGQAIRSLTTTVQEATRAAVQIAASSQQQLAGMEQVGRAMENIKQATSQNAEGARQLATAARSLQDVGARLKALVDSDHGAAPASAGR
jgi:methyl-accepting chemotaxis protein